MQRAKTYDPRNGPSFGELTREHISQVVKAGDDVVKWVNPRSNIFINGSAAGNKPTGANGVKAQPAVNPASTTKLATDGSALPPTTPVASSTFSAPLPVSTPTSTAIAPTNPFGFSTGANASIVREVIDGQPQPQQPPAPPAPVPKPPPSSWAALVRPKNVAPTPTAAAPAAATIKAGVNKTFPANGNRIKTIGDVVQVYEHSYVSTLFQPRGLVNTGNMCFMNAILQPLAHCAPFYNLFKTIGDQVPHSFKSKDPLIESLNVFVKEFTPAKKDIPEFGDSLSPEYVYDALRTLKRFDSIRGRQEDCQEFLGYLLDGLHEEFLAAKGTAGQALIEHVGEEENGWLEVTGHKKSSHTRSTETPKTPISEIFSGQMRSTLSVPSQKDSVTVEPFQTLQLDLTPDNVHTIEDALYNSTLPEVLEGFRIPEKPGVSVDATKRTVIEAAPPVLIVHLKRFIFHNGTTQKLHKHVGYKTTLQIQPELISPVSRHQGAITYQLFGVVYHHGSSASGGHYTCDVLRQNAEWLHIDDAIISHITEEDVVADTSTESGSHGTNGYYGNGTSSVNGNNGSPLISPLQAAIAASSMPTHRASGGVAYVLFYLRSDKIPAVVSKPPAANGSGPRPQAAPRTASTASSTGSSTHTKTSSSISAANSSKPVAAGNSQTAGKKPVANGHHSTPHSNMTRSG